MLNLWRRQKGYRRCRTRGGIHRAANQLAVVDGSGDFTAHVHMDKGRLGIEDVAVNKARTARAFEMPPKEMARDVVGAFGGSGGFSGYDEAVAESAAQALWGPSAGVTQHA